MLLSVTLTPVMAHTLVQFVAMLTTFLAVAGMGYFVAAIVAARRFLAARRAPLGEFAPGVSVLKSLKGLDPGMMEAFSSHCRQSYAGHYELLFGVSSLEDPAVAAVELLQDEFPHHSIRLIECPERLGTNGKVSTLVQLVDQARYDFLLINDSDITVSSRYLERVMGCFVPSKSDRTDAAEVGLVTALYRGRAHETLPSRLEALGIATDFQAGVLLSKMIEGGLHYGLGSTLAIRREALNEIGGLESLVNHLADDYELGARVDRAGFRVVLSPEVVETNVAAYGWRGYLDHQLRWSRTVRDARPWGYVGLIFTHGLSWALLNVIASGASLLSLGLLGTSLILRLSLAMVVGDQVLGDRQVRPRLGLLPLRDLVATGVWVAGFAGSTIVWRGESYSLKHGRLRKVGKSS
jgi:ceramide glucosyltransferase